MPDARAVYLHRIHLTPLLLRLAHRYHRLGEGVYPLDPPIQGVDTMRVSLRAPWREDASQPTVYRATYRVDLLAGDERLSWVEFTTATSAYGGRDVLRPVDAVPVEPAPHDDYTIFDPKNQEHPDE